MKELYQGASLRRTRTPHRVVIAKPENPMHPKNTRGGSIISDIFDLGGYQSEVGVLGHNPNYVDFRDRWGTQKHFFVWHRQDPRGGPPPPKMASEPIPEGNDP